jgi:tetratricopeptide (TPR) repeat protein
MNKGFLFILLISFLLLFSYADCYAQASIGTEIAKTLCWPMVVLILGVVFLITQKDSIGKFIGGIREVVFERRKGKGEVIYISGSRLTTLPAEPTDKSKVDRSVKIETLLREGKFDDIKEECEKWKAEDRKTTLPYIYLGRSLIKQGRYPEAGTEFEKALVVEANNAEAYYYLGVLQQRQGDLKGSEQYIKTAYKLKKDDPRITLNLAYISYYLYNNVEKSLDFIQKSRNDYKEGKFPYETDLNIIIHQSFEYYLAARGKEEDFQRAFEIDEFIDGKYEGLEDEEKSFTLDTRGYLRLRAAEEGYEPKTKVLEKEKDLVQSALNFLSEAVELNPSDQEITLRLARAVKLQGKRRQI